MKITIDISVSLPYIRIIATPTGASPMGMYIYRVTARLVRLADGRKAHVCQYAYKPYGHWGSEKHNAKMHFKTGCVASEGMKLKSDLLVTFDTHEHEGRLYQNPHGLRTFYDDVTFGTENMPRLGEVKRTVHGVDKWEVVA